MKGAARGMEKGGHVVRLSSHYEQYVMSIAQITDRKRYFVAIKSSFEYIRIEQIYVSFAKSIATRTPRT